MHVKTTSHFTGRATLRSTTLDRLARSVVDSGAAPAMVCAAAFWSEKGWKYGVGAAGTLWPIAPTRVTPDMVFDLASLTKPMVAIAAATESTRGRVVWFSPLQELLPEVAGTCGGTATLEQLLAHRAGLKPHLELFRAWQAGRAITVAELLRTAANACNDCVLPPSETVRAVYSDLGYLLAGAAIERHLGVALDTWLSATLPSLAAIELGSVRDWLARDSAFLSRCAPTEVVPWRGGLVWGRVHDENAWLASGFGLSGHAGLFGTAVGVARVGAAVIDALLGRSSEVPASAARLTTQSRDGGSLRAGFDGKSDSNSTAGDTTSSDAFGHLGFTGTSFWCDPSRSLVSVVLTNRVCPTRANPALRGLRAQLHETLFHWAESAQFGQPT